MNPNQDMYQASDGKWYPRSDMPQGYAPQPGYGGGYGGQPQMGYGQPGYGQPQQVYVQQSRPGGSGAGAAAGMGCCAALCGALLCFDLGACLF